MDANNALLASDTAVPLSEDIVMTTETTTQSVRVEEISPNQDPLDQALAEPVQKEDYDSSDLDLSSDEDSSSADEGNTKHDDDIDDDDDDDDDDEEERPSKSIPVSAHELTEITIERPQFEMTDETPVEYIGMIVSVIDKTVVVQSKSHGQVLDMESLLVFEQDRKILGEVFETFGPVDRPFYSVRFNTVDEIPPLAQKDARICYVPSYERTQLVQVEKLKLIKGTDASNRFDEEAGDDELEFSDDEQEMAYNRSKKKKHKKQQKKKATTNNTTDQPQNYNSTADNDRRQLQSYADIMGPSLTNPVQSRRQPDIMGDLLNSYMSARPSPPTQFQHTSSTTVKQEPSASPATIIKQEPSTSPATIIKQEPSVSPVTTIKQEPSAPTTTIIKQESTTIVEQELPISSIMTTDPSVSQESAQPTSEPTPEQPSPSFFQSIRSLFSRAPPSS